MLFVEFGINLIVAVLLVTTILYCWVLNKRIRVLQDSRSELADLLMHFDLSTQKAAESIHTLQLTSKKIAETIQSRIEKANYISEDLHFLVERAEKLADRMEAGISAQRAAPVAPLSQPDQPVAAIKRHEVETDREQARAAVEKARAAVEAEAKQRMPQPAPRMPRSNHFAHREEEQEAASASLQHMLEKLAARQVSDPALRTGARQSAPAKQRSRAEQELLEIIKAGSKA